MGTIITIIDAHVIVPTMADYTEHVDEAPTEVGTLPLPPPPLPHLINSEDLGDDGTEPYHLGVKKSIGAAPFLPPGWRAAPKQRHPAVASLTARGPSLPSFYPSTENDRAGGQISRTLPENMYGAFILIWLNCGRVAEAAQRPGACRIG